MTAGKAHAVLRRAPCQRKPYQARVRRGGQQVYLGNFATAEKAALCVARTPEGQAVAAQRAATAAPLTSEEVRQQAQAEKLTLLVAETRPGGGRGKGNFSWFFCLERSILMTGWVQCRSEVRYPLTSRFNTPPTACSFQNAKKGDLFVFRSSSRV